MTAPGTGPRLDAPDLDSAVDALRASGLCSSCGAVKAVEPEEMTPVRSAIRERFGHRAEFGHFPILGREGS
jgi:hypothetical protein